MKTHKVLFIVLILFVFGQINAQNKSAEVSSIEILLNSKNFEFIANTMIPMSGGTKNLVGSNYSITFTPEMIISNMPFYGRAYSGAAMSRDRGMRFKGKPENFTINKNEKNFEVNATVNGKADTYFISITVGDSGFANLSISSSDRAVISYQGEIIKIQE